jgi:hypothetical protein
VDVLIVVVLGVLAVLAMMAKLYFFETHPAPGSERRRPLTPARIALISVLSAVGGLVILNLKGTDVGAAWQAGTAVVVAATIASTLTLVARRRGRSGSDR